MNSQKIINELSQETMDKINEVFDFVQLNKARIEKNTETWLTPKEAAKYLRISLSQLMQHEKDKIGYSRTGRVIVFEVKDLDEYRKQRKVIGKMYGDPDDLDDFRYKRKNKSVKRSQGMAT